MSQIRVLFIGDIVGNPGRAILRDQLSGLVEESRIDFVVANAENAAGGSGLTSAIARELHASGINAITMGDHVWRQLDIVPLLEDDPRVVRPINLAASAAGKGFTILDGPHGGKIGIINAQGRVFMKPSECPFAAIEAVLEQIHEQTHVILVDFHAEATSEKIAMGWFLDGRVSAVVGTHTHVMTADAVVLPGGTGYITDVGMTGPHDGVIGRRKDRVIMSLTTQMPYRFDVAQHDVRISGVIIDVDTEQGRASGIEPVVVNEAGEHLLIPRLSDARDSEN